MDDLAATRAFAVVAVLFIAYMLIRRDVFETSRAIIIDLEFGDDSLSYGKWWLAQYSPLRS